MDFQGENNFSSSTVEAAPYISSELSECKDYINRFYSEEGIQGKEWKRGEGNLILLPLKLTLRLYLSNRILLNTHPLGDTGTQKARLCPQGICSLMRPLHQVHK